MQEKTIVKNRLPNTGNARELIDVLIAISVVAKRLAENLRKQLKEGDRQYEQNE